mgnify:CR=1 FL=1
MWGTQPWAADVGLYKGGPYIGPRGGKWADPQHKVAWKPESKKRRKKAKEEPKDKKPSPGTQLPKRVQAKLKKLGVGKLPEASIPRKDIQLRLDGDPHVAAVIKWHDTSGRPQSGYTPTFHKRNADKKWATILAFSAEHPQTVRRIMGALKRAEPGSKEHQSALVAAIIAKTGLRPGGRQSLAGHYGVSTMTPAHVTIEGSSVSIDFKGKQGKQNTATIRSPVIAAALSPYMKGGNKKRKPMFRGKVLDDARKLLPEGLKLKDLRTLLATQVGTKVLNAQPVPTLTGNRAKDKRLLAKALLAASKHVAKLINNTPAVARASYIHPQVFKKWAIERVGADPSLFEEE